MVEQEKKVGQLGDELRNAQAALAAEFPEAVLSLPLVAAQYGRLFPADAPAAPVLAHLRSELAAFCAGVRQIRRDGDYFSRDWRAFPAPIRRRLMRLMKSRQALASSLSASLARNSAIQPGKVFS